MILIADSSSAKKSFAHEKCFLASAKVVLIGERLLGGYVEAVKRKRGYL